MPYCVADRVNALLPFTLQRVCVFVPGPVSVRIGSRYSLQESPCGVGGDGFLQGEAAEAASTIALTVGAANAQQPRD